MTVEFDLDAVAAVHVARLAGDIQRLAANIFISRSSTKTCASCKISYSSAWRRMHAKAGRSHNLDHRDRTCHR